MKAMIFVLKTITGIIGSIRKLTTDYFDIYGRDVRLNAAAISGGGMSSRSATVEPDDIADISEP